MPVYKCDGGSFVVSAYGCWVPESFTSERAAKYMLRFSPEDQGKMWEQWKAKHPAMVPDLSFEDMQSWRKTGSFEKAGCL